MPTLSQKKRTPADTISKIKAIRGRELSVETLFNGIVQGDKALLAKAITLLESEQPAHFDKADALVEKCLGRAKQSIRLGISGVPGVGKSTFIEALGNLLTAAGKQVAVLAVDPSSQLGKGSILGDKTRMQTLANDPKAFIRPSPSGTALGGVARKTRESIMLCEAAGYEVILVETVGVGQSEVAVANMVDFFLLLQLPGAGDELQGIKRGIMEMADAMVINKADGDNLQRARQARAEFKRALHLHPPKANGWVPPVLLCSSTENTGIAEIWRVVEDFVRRGRENGHFDKNRKGQNRHWFLQGIDQQLSRLLDRDPNFKSRKEALLRQVEAGEISPFYAAKVLMGQLGLKDLNLHRSKTQ